MASVFQRQHCLTPTAIVPHGICWSEGMSRRSLAAGSSKENAKQTGKGQIAGIPPLSTGASVSAAPACKQLEEEDSDLAAEVQRVSSLLAKLPTVRAMASLWMVRWPVTAGEDQACLLRLPSAMLGPDANKMLQQAKDACWYAWEMAGVPWQGREQ